ncbi:type VI secretion system protein ImpL [Kosakonia arachidis]|uniref:Type VI secretion system protein ImpL n=1 Tax=Kosakonia arachidis TaxID=551989 RepID=A0A1I7DXF8_9ENTR|nr:type VI secretion protein IcmF/TssM N-terminal domain-containing protein [Kosakonia arachidis]SFU16354.1 type VI secretion system protein ImpL [Kosakonia arachidis]
MFKKLACFTGWLAVLCLSLMFSFMLGLWQGWGTATILLLWLLVMVLTALLWHSLPELLLLIRGKKGRRWFTKYRLSRREYVLFNHWKAGAAVIKRIKRRRTHLPWYLLVGDRCGKSTLLSSAGLPRFYGDSADSITTPTRTLRWWFFRDLCVLDLSSNFLNGTASFRQAWSKLARWCTHIPAPGGIIIALPMSQLMASDLSQLHRLARQQRSLVEPLVRHYGERLPLYVLVTQCDTFPGFSLWQHQLSDAQRQQALGYTWSMPPCIDGQDDTTLQPLFAHLHEGFSLVRLSMARPDTLSALEYNALLDFPEAFARLEPALRFTLAALCEANAYFSPVTLKSIWFCSTEPQVENQGRRTSHFIQDLLTRHLPALSLKKSGLRWYQRSFGRTCCYTAIGVCALWLAISASMSAMRLRSGLAELAPDKLAAFIAADEQHATLALPWLPFTPLFSQQRHNAETLLTRIPVTPRPARQTLEAFQLRALNASPAQQRHYILQLAVAVTHWRQMQRGAPLDTLAGSSPISDELMQNVYPSALSPLTRLALERYYIQRPHGKRWLQNAQRVLDNLVNNDLSLRWLQAPNTAFPPLHAATFWPALPDSLALDGRWTQAGEATINHWMAEIEAATGRPEPIFQPLRESWPETRQQAWRQYLIEVTAHLSPDETLPASRRQLIAIGQNQSPAMRFAARIVDELEAILPQQAQPWLTTLRDVQTLASAGDGTSLRQFNQQLRLSLADWFQGNTQTTAAATTQSAQQAWLDWQKSRNSAVNAAVAQEKPRDTLTHGLFTPRQQKPDANPLGALLPALATLEERASPDDIEADVAEVWRLYQDDARTLLANAMANSACWLNEQWKSSVIWPLGKNTEKRSYEEQQTLSQQLVSNFLRGPARPMLSVDSNGLSAAGFAGMTLPLTTEFSQFLRSAFTPDILQDLPQRTTTKIQDQKAALQAKVAALELQQTKLEQQVVKTTVTSLPATIAGGAQVIPTGTKLLLNCQKGDQVLSSMNFADKADFTWQPGQCRGVTLSVTFPDFVAISQINGDDAWPWFVSLFSSGETLINSSDFGDSAEWLKRLGIKQILVRFTMTNTPPLEDAWQSWKTNADEISALTQQIRDLNEQSAHPQPDELVAHALSGFPDNITQCQ